MTVQLLNGFTAKESDKTTCRQTKQLLVLNLMPNRAVTEQQFTSLLSGTDVDVAVTFAIPASHRIRHHPVAVQQRYTTLADIKNRYFDGVIVTGAPLDQTPEQAIDFWPEFQDFMRWQVDHIARRLFICWGAYAAGLVTKEFLPIKLNDKIFGVTETQGFIMPQSRYFTIPLANVDTGQVIAGDRKTGATIIQNQQTRTVYVTGHYEYGPNNLAMEFRRDQRRGMLIAKPTGYFGDDGRPMAHWHEQGIHIVEQWLKDEEITNG